MEKQGTHEYQVLVTRCKQTLHQVEPLREVEPAGNARYLMRICDRNSNVQILNVLIFSM